MAHSDSVQKTWSGRLEVFSAKVEPEMDRYGAVSTERASKKRRLSGEESRLQPESTKRRAMKQSSSRSNNNNFRSTRSTGRGPIRSQPSRNRTHVTRTDALREKNAISRLSSPPGHYGSNAMQSSQSQPSQETLDPSGADANSDYLTDEGIIDSRPAFKPQVSAGTCGPVTENEPETLTDYEEFMPTVPSTAKSSDPTHSEENLREPSGKGESNHIDASVPIAEDKLGPPHQSSTEPPLCEEQKQLVNLIVEGHNVFFTGSAGCGKSTVLRNFVRILESQGKRVRIVAPTGRAALNVGGTTTWSFVGWVPGDMKSTFEKLVGKSHREKVKKRLEETDVLVIDEISMVENHLFERINRVMKSVRKQREAFGGVQVVVTGDFCQLPPVNPFEHCIECGSPTVKEPGYDELRFACHNDECLERAFCDADKWAFRSAAWKECNFAHINLTQIHRQNERDLIDILQKCRMGTQLDSADRDLLLRHSCNTENATKLFPTRREVERINREEFRKLGMKRKLSFRSHDNFDPSENHDQAFRRIYGERLADGSLRKLEEHRYEKMLEVKEGMLVVLLNNINISKGLINGAQGVVIGFQGHDEEFMKRKYRVEGSEDPEYRESQRYKEGQVRKFIDSALVKEWPTVRFTNGLVRTIFPDCVFNEIGDSKPYAKISRAQIPLMMAWAMTIHKSQGLTLDRVIVDLNWTFEEGQMYVALSRARSFEGLKVEGLPNWQGAGNKMVKQFLHKIFGI